MGEQKSIDGEKEHDQARQQATGEVMVEEGGLLEVVGEKLETGETKGDSPDRPRRRAGSPWRLIRTCGWQSRLKTLNTENRVRPAMQTMQRAWRLCLLDIGG